MPASKNRVDLIGHVGKDPEVTFFEGGGSVANFSLATSERWTDKSTGEARERTQWHQIKVFNQALVEVCSNYVKKGSFLEIEGALEYREYEKGGQKHRVAEVVLKPFAGEIRFLGPAPERPEPVATSASDPEPPL